MEEVKPEITEEAKELTNNTMDLLFNRSMDKTTTMFPKSGLC